MRRFKGSWDFAAGPFAQESERLRHSFIFSVLTQNPHPASSTQQAEQASFTNEQIPKRASQFSLKINKRQSS
jgi:hypothetical protein